MEFFLSGGELVPDGFALDGDGNLRADTAAEQYGEELEDAESEAVASAKAEEESGRGKRRRIANRHYSGSEFWKH
jgi:hypothetical protein